VIGFLRRLHGNRARAALYGRCLAPPVHLIVLRYHAVAETGDADRYVHPGLSVSPARFREQVRLLVRRFHVVTADEIPELLATGDAGAARGSRTPAALITFDDGYRDNHDMATPILVDERASATFFVATAPLEPGRFFWVSELRGMVKSLPAGTLRLPGATDAFKVPRTGPGRDRVSRDLTRYLSALAATERETAMDELARAAGLPRGAELDGTWLRPSDLLAMAAAGMIIGAHTVTHPHLDRVAPAHMQAEVAGSRSALERILARPVEHFAYPNPGGGGRFTGAGRDAVQAAAFRTAFTSSPERLAPGVDLLRLPRLGVNRGDAERALFDRLTRFAEHAG